MHAIQHAKNANAPLAFLFVADKRLPIEHDSSLDEAIEQELIWLGRVLLHVARERAARSDVEAAVSIAVGPVREEIIRYLQQVDAHLLVLGAPRETTTIFGDDSIKRFAAEITEACGVRVEIARPGA
jgi:nucleotide-binding universal stress UspA family protein